MKNYKIEVLPIAKRDLENIIDYLSAFYPNTATKQLERIFDNIESLKKFPEMGGYYDYLIDGEKFRKLVIDDYIVLYHVNPESFVIEIYRVVNAKRDLFRLL